MMKLNSATTDLARGKGKGQGGPQQGDGGTDTCVCPDCGATAKHERGTPCTGLSCPKCGAKMTGKPTANEGLNSLKHLMSTMIRKDQIDGEDYYVVPTVLIVEGVHTGLDGTPTYYPAKELAKFPEAWNGRPIVVMHPDLNGHAVTASSPELLERQTVGNLYHCKFENNKLKGESWIKINKCFKISAEVMDMLEKNQPIEVSTGLFVESETKDGVWNNEEYKNTVFNFRPDHLALLPGAVGACSWQDGAGMPRLNEGKGKDDMSSNSVVALVKKLASLVVGKTPTVLELSHEKIRSAISAKLGSDQPSTVGNLDMIPYIVEMFDKYAIYEVGSKIHKQAYSIGADDVVELVGASIEVEREIKYVPVKGTTNLQGKKTSKKEGPNMDRKAKIAALIATGSWGEDSQEFLTGLEDAQFAVVEKITLNQKVEAEDDKGKKEVKKKVVTLEALLGVEADPEAEESEAIKLARNAYKEAIEAEAKDKVTANKGAKKVVEDEKPQTVEQFIANAPPGMRDTLSRSVKRDSAIKATLVASLVDNKRNEFSKEVLEGKSLAELESLAKLGQITPDFGGQNPAVNEDDENKAPEMVRMQWGKDKEKKEEK